MTPQSTGYTIHFDANGGTVTLYAIWEKNPTPTPTPAASKTVTKTVTETVEYLPETGDDVPLVPIAITAAAALSFGMLALYRRRRND